MYSTTRHNFTSIELLVFHKTTVLAQLPNTKIHFTNAVDIWRKYCWYGVKHYSINYSTKAVTAIQNEIWIYDAENEYLPVL